MTGFTPGDLKATGSATSVTRYYYSGQQLVESDTAVNGVTTTRYQYLWSPRYIDAPILRDTLNTDGSVNTGDRIFYLTDANYNVTAVVGMSGGSWQVVERYRYDAYGKVTVCSPNGNPIGGNASQFGNTILYAGETFDSSTGLYYDRAGITIPSWAGSSAKIQWAPPAAAATSTPTAAITRRTRPTRAAKSPRSHQLHRRL